MTRQVLRALIAVTAVVVFVASASAAFAIWRATSAATLTVGITAPVTTSPTPGPVTGLSCSAATFNGNNVNLSWNAATDATAYKLFVKRANGAYAEFMSAPSNTASFNENFISAAGGVAPYRVVVEAMNGQVAGPTSSNAFVITFGNSQSRGCTTGAP